MWTTHEDLFASRWDKAFTEMGLESPDPIVATRWYGEQHRRHHTGIHALTVELALRKESPVLRLAGLLHDVVNDPELQDNEFRSCDVAREILVGYMPGYFIDELTKHIMQASSYGRCRTWGDTQLHDADFAILAMNEMHYTRYAFNVREEYRMYSDEQWCAGRMGFLEKLLKSDAIFFPQNAIYEADARANMSDELTQLKKAEL